MRKQLILVVAASALFGAVVAPVAVAEEGEESIDYHEWASKDDFLTGGFAGISAGDGALRLAEPLGVANRDPDYEYGQWVSPEYRQGFGATELIASWNAETPDGTWLRVEAQGRTASGERTAWYGLGRWAEGDADIRRTSVPGQDDTHAAVNVDTLATKGDVTLRSYRLRVTLYREKGSDSSPALRSVGAMTSRVPDRFEVPVSRAGVASGVELDVPRYAQNVHKGHYPEYGGGGEVWCSPTSTEMVVEYYGTGPDARELAWIPEGYVDPSVANAARYTYDYAYEGTGNWPFNTAYAARYGLDARVTRLHSLAAAEDYIANGVPVVASLSFLASELDGAGYGTEGHLMVIIGFTADGDVIVNDPAADSNDEVRNVYPREQFEIVWQRTKRLDADGEIASGSGGVAYLVTPES